EDEAPQCTVRFTGAHSMQVETGFDFDPATRNTPQSSPVEVRKGWRLDGAFGAAGLRLSFAGTGGFHRRPFQLVLQLRSNWLRCRERFRMPGRRMHSRLPSEGLQATSHR